MLRPLHQHRTRVDRPPYKKEKGKKKKQHEVWNKGRGSVVTGLGTTNGAGDGSGSPTLTSIESKLASLSVPSTPL